MIMMAGPDMHYNKKMFRFFILAVIPAILSGMFLLQEENY